MGRPLVSNQDISPSPKLLSPQRVQNNNQQNTMQNEGSNATMRSLEYSQTVEVHSPNHKNTVSPSAQQMTNERLQEQSKLIESLRKQIDELKRENENKQRQIDNAANRERQHKESINSMKSDIDSLRRDHGSVEEKRSLLEEENERLSRELTMAQERMESLDLSQQELKNRLKNVIDSKLTLIKSTSEEIDHYRKLIQQIAQNKLGCQLLSDFANS